MKKIKNKIIFSLLYVISFSCSSAEIGPDCKFIPMTVALSNSDALEGQLVALGGLLSFKREEIMVSMLYLDQLSYDHGYDQHGISLKIYPVAKNLERINGKFGIVCGVITYTRENNLYKAPHLKDIQYVKVEGATWRKGKWTVE